MAHTASWNKSAPLNTAKAGLGAQDIREMKRDAEERMQLDHYWTSSTDTTAANADGYHKKITLRQGSAPSAMTNAGIVYSMDVSSKAELHYIDNNGDSVQITSNGKLCIYPGFHNKSACYIYASSEVYDLNNEFNVTTFKFVPENPGYYFLKEASLGTAITIYNGTTPVPISTSKTVCGSMVVSLIAGDEIQFGSMPTEFFIMRLS